MTSPGPHGKSLGASPRPQSSGPGRLLPAGFVLPDWPALVASSHHAHARLPGVWAIAWDWVLTPDGPVLLEGNAGWGVSAPQLLNGGFLADAGT